MALASRQPLCGPCGLLTKPWDFPSLLSLPLFTQQVQLGFLRDGQVGFKLWKHLQPFRLLP